jgi:D-psicose/D-tagatose/L-ribulose 3-epimerase
VEIKYSISNWIFGIDPLEDQFKRLKTYGYDAIEIMVSEMERFNIKKVKDCILNYSLPCCSICTMMRDSSDKNLRRNLIDDNEGVRKRSLDYLKSCLEIGKELNAKLVLAVPSGVANVRDGWNEMNKERCIEAILELGDFAKSLGSIYFVIEPINRYENAFLTRCEQAKTLIKETKHSRIKMMLDFFHTNIEENNNGDAIRMAGEDLIHCHIADSNRKSPGRGHTDWFEILRALRDIGFEGSLACEPLPPSGADVFVNLNGTRDDADLYAKESIQYLKFIENILVKKK